MADGSAAEAAYEAALREIERVRAAGGSELRLSGQTFLALDRIPPAVAEIEGLRSLNLNYTKVNDLSPLRTLTGLRRLSLAHTKVREISQLRNLTDLRYLSMYRTAVSDLTPLSEMQNLQTLFVSRTKVSDLRPIEVASRRSASRGRSQLNDLRFNDIPALTRDAELLRLSKLGDRQERVSQTLAYLKTLPQWPEPLPWEKTSTEKAEPEQDPALPLIWGEKGFTFLARSVDADPVTEAALDDLRALLEDLRRKGNRHDDLYRLAGEMQERAAGEIADLHMVKLHLSYQKLRRLYQSRGSRAEAFDDETVGVLGSVLEILPGVTLADPGVEKLIQRQEAERLAGTNPEKVAAEAGMLMAVQSDDAPFADEVKDAAKVILEQGHDDRLTATRGILSRNSLIAVLKGVGGIGVGAVIVGPLGNYVYDHGAELLALARTMGDDAFLWTQMALSSVKAEYQLAAGVAREALSSGLVALPGKTKAEKT